METRKAMLTALGIAAIAGLLAPALSAAQQPHTFTVIATGLEAPRGLKFGPDGALYVAEAGLGGKHSTAGQCKQVPAPPGPYTGGSTGRISKITAGGCSHGNPNSDSGIVPAPILGVGRILRFDVPPAW